MFSFGFIGGFNGLLESNRYTAMVRNWVGDTGGSKNSALHWTPISLSMALIWIQLLFIVNFRRVDNRPFAQLLSGLETGHPAAAGRSPAY